MKELRKYIEDALGNSIRCMLPSVWWKKLFGKVIDQIEEVDGKLDDVTLSLDEFKRENPSWKEMLLYAEPTDEQKEANQRMIVKVYYKLVNGVQTGIETNTQLYLAVPLMSSFNQYSIHSPQWTFSTNIFGIEFYNVPFYDGKMYNIEIPYEGEVNMIPATAGNQQFKTINGQSILGEGNIVIEGGGGSSIVVDSAISSTSTNPVQNRVISNALSYKQNTISDLDTIRAGAAKGATALQSVPLQYVTETELSNKGYATNASLASVAKSGSYNDLTNKPTIPSAVTESTVSGWGFTKNSGTYSKPSGGIPKTDLASAVQTSLGKADTALQSYTEKYTGTVTGVKVNGTTKNPSSGVVDLGTVITSHQSISHLATKTELSSKQDTITDLATIRSNASLGATAIQEVKTINGEPVVGSGNIEVFTKDLYDNLIDETIANEEVYAAAVSDLNSRLLVTDNALDAEVATREALSAEVTELSNTVNTNAEVVAESYNELNDRINANYQHSEATYTTKVEFQTEVASLVSTIVENEEIHAAAINDLLARINALIARVEQLENA